MSISQPLLRAVAAVALIAASTALSVSVGLAACECDVCCTMSYCHAYLSPGQGLICHRYDKEFGQGEFNYTGGPACGGEPVDAGEQVNQYECLCFEYCDEECSGSNEATSCTTGEFLHSVGRWICQTEEDPPETSQ